MAPRFWIEGKRLTMTFFLAMVRAPLARFTVTIIGSISGRQPDGDREAEEEGLEPVAFGEPDDQEDRADHDHHEADHEPGE